MWTVKFNHNFASVLMTNLTKKQLNKLERTRLSSRLFYVSFSFQSDVRSLEIISTKFTNKSPTALIKFNNLA